ncbi:MAG: cellobiose system component [Chloroflexota bacterium]|nr:cellobiose system component [Chloroflexota bacterium]
MRILLVCYAGMSTGILVKKIREEAEVKGIDLEIEALPWTELDGNTDNTDIILLGPQVRFALDECKKMVGDQIPVVVIDSADYGLMNGKAVLEKALRHLNPGEN